MSLRLSHTRLSFLGLLVGRPRRHLRISMKHLRILFRLAHRTSRSQWLLFA